MEGPELYRTALALFSERLERVTSIVPQSSGLSARFPALPGPEADLIAANGRVSDLIITAHPAEDGSSWPNLSLESAIRETDCPVLLIPRAVSRISFAASSALAFLERCTTDRVQTSPTRIDRSHECALLYAVHGKVRNVRGLVDWKAHMPALISWTARSMKPSKTRRTWPSSTRTSAASRSLTTLRMTSSSPGSSKSAMTTVSA